MRTNHCLILIVISVFLLTFAGYTGSNEIILKAATIKETGSSEARALTEFKRLVEEQTKGRVRVEVFTDGVLGTEENLVKGLQMGTVDVVIVASFKYSLYVPEFQLLNLSFLFAGGEHWENSLYGPVGKKMGKIASQRRGDTVMGYMTEGPRNIFSREEIMSLNDLRGKKIRIMTTPLEIAVWKALGAIPRAVARHDLNAALQTGLVDAAENNFLTIKEMRYYEPPCKYILRTEHNFPTSLFVVGKPTVDRLPDELRQIVIDCGRKAAAWQVKQSFQENEETELELIYRYWVKITELTSEERDIWVEKVAPIQDRVAAETGLKNLLKEIRDSVPEEPPKRSDVKKPSDSEEKSEGLQ